MADSSSESEQSFDIEAIHQDSREHVREVLNKGKQITPFYNDSVLYEIFKRYYQNDQIFYNQLRIISKRAKEAEGQQGWVTIGKDKKNKAKSGKYNFLQDKRLIWRAKNWDKEEAKERSRYNNQVSQKQSYDSRKQGNQTKYKEKSTSRNDGNENRDRYATKKQSNRFREKDERDQNKNTKSDVRSSNIQNENKNKKTQYAQKTQKDTKQANDSNAENTKVNEKVEKKAQKIQTAATTQNVTSAGQNQGSTSNKQTQNAKKQAEKKKFVQKKQNTTQTKTSWKEELKKVEGKTVQTKQTAEAKIGKVESKDEKVESKNEKVESKNEKVENKNEKVENKNGKVTEHSSTNEVNTVNQEIVQLPATEIEKNFELSVKKYPKILKFVKPTDKMSKISYVWNNGHPENVKVVVPVQNKNKI